MYKAIKSILCLSLTKFVDVENTRKLSAASSEPIQEGFKSNARDFRAACGTSAIRQNRKRDPLVSHMPTGFLCPGFVALTSERFPTICPIFDILIRFRASASRTSSTCSNRISLLANCGGGNAAGTCAGIDRGNNILRNRTSE